MSPSCFQNCFFQVRLEKLLSLSFEAMSGTLSSLYSTLLSHLVSSLCSTLLSPLVCCPNFLCTWAGAALRRQAMPRQRGCMSWWQQWQHKLQGAAACGWVGGGGSSTEAICEARVGSSDMTLEWPAAMWLRSSSRLWLPCSTRTSASAMTCWTSFKCCSHRSRRPRISPARQARCWESSLQAALMAMPPNTSQRFLTKRRCSSRWTEGRQGRARRRGVEEERSGAQRRLMSAVACTRRRAARKAHDGARPRRSRAVAVAAARRS